MGGKSGGSSNTTTSRVEIPQFLQPFLQQAAGTAGRSLGQLESRLGGAGAGDIVAPFSEDQLASFDLARQATAPSGAFDQAQQLITQATQGASLEDFIDPAALGALRQTAGGDFLAGGEGFNQTIDAAVRAALPRVASTFGASGRGTGGLAQAAIGEAATDAAIQNLSQERARQLNASQLLSSLGSSERGRQIQARLQGAGLLPGIATDRVGLLGNIGAQQQAQAQQRLTAPITASQQLFNTASGALPTSSLLGQSVSQPGTSSFGSGLLSGLGGSLTGARLGAMSGTPFGVGAGAIGGGTIGLLGGLFS